MSVYETLSAAKAAWRSRVADVVKMGMRTLANPATGKASHTLFMDDLMETVFPDGKPLMNFLGDWSSANTPYATSSVVTDDGWLMIANKETNDKAAPESVGAQFNYFDGTLVPDTLLASQITFGTRYNNPTEALFLNSWRIYADIDIHYQVFIVVDPLGANPGVAKLAEFTASTTGWLNFPIGSRIVPIGTTFQLIANVNEPDPTPTIFSGNWDYQKPNNESPLPAAGVITHANRALDTIYINSTDDDAGDRLAELEALTAGDLIVGGGMAWTIISHTTTLGVVAFLINPAQQAPLIGVQQFDFHTVTATPIPFDEDTGFYAADPNVSGLQSSDGAPLAVSDNAFGIDMAVQLASVSDDWDVMAASGASGAGSEGSATGRFGALAGAELITVFAISWKGRNTNGLCEVLNERRGIEVERTAKGFYTCRFDPGVVDPATLIVPVTIVTGLPVETSGEIRVEDVGMANPNEILVNTGTRNKNGQFNDDDLIQEPSNFVAIIGERYG